LLLRYQVFDAFPIDKIFVAGISKICQCLLDIINVV
jgi:hypothetical protein